MMRIFQQIRDPLLMHLMRLLVVQLLMGLPLLDAYSDSQEGIAMAVKYHAILFVMLPIR